MPTPNPKESESHYVHRAIPQLMGEGHPQRQSVAIAYSMWRRRRSARRRQKSITWHESKQAVPVQRPSWQATKNMGQAVSPAMSSIDQTAGGALRPPYHFGDLKPFYRRKLKKKGAVELVRNTPAIVPAEPKSLDPMECVGERCQKTLGPGWSYKFAGVDRHGYGLDLAIQGPPQFDEDALSITFPFAASHGRDRVGDFLKVEGIDTTNHRRNPVAFLDHGKYHHMPIGKCESPAGEYTVSIDKERGLAIATVFLDRDETTENGKMARQVFSLFRQGILRAGSIGYRPIGTPKKLPADPKTGTPAGLLLDKVELLEATLAALPANGDAVRRALDIGCDGKPWTPAVKTMLESMIAS